LREIRPRKKGPLSARYIWGNSSKAVKRKAPLRIARGMLIRAQNNTSVDYKRD
jgi:hypothetical protein